MRLIDAEVLQKHLDDVMHDELCYPDYKKACFAISIYVDGMTTIEAEPVRYGKWECVNVDENVYMALCCGGEFLLESGTPLEHEMIFCPYCGAKMDGDTGE